jgi:rhomboid protease GluP
MYGVFLALLTTNLIEKTRRFALLTSIGIFVGYNLFYGANGSIDNAAHIGGLVSGIVIGYFYYPGLKSPAKSSLLYSPIAVAALLVVAVCFLAFKKIPNTYGLFDQKMRAFARYEKKALAITHGLDSDTPKEVWLHALGDSGIYYWNQCIQVINEARQLKVSDELKDRSDALIEYCNLRIQSYNYYYKKIAGTTSPGMDSLTYYNSQITDLMESLKNRR